MRAKNRSRTQCSAFKYLQMHAWYSKLKPIPMSTCSFAYWLFHAITSERKDLSKIHELKTEKSLKQPPTYLIFSVETIDVAAKVVTNKQTDRHTHTQDNYCNPPLHARRGLNIRESVDALYRNGQGVTDVPILRG